MSGGPTADHAHLSIGEVLTLLQDEFPDVTISKIRFLESQGLLDPERTPSGYRKFYEDDISRLRWILTQQKENFLPLKVIKDRLSGQSGTPAGEDRPAPDSPHEPGGPEEPVDPPASEREPRRAQGAEPIWMADAARAAAARSSDDELAGGLTRSQRSTATPLDVGPTTVSLTFAELATASGLEASSLRELEKFGLIEGNSVGADSYYDGDALVIAQKAAGFLRHGIEARHLRMFKVAAEREAGFLEQVVMPMVKQRNPAARKQAVGTLGELASLGQSLRAALLRHALRDHLS